MFFQGSASRECVSRADFELVEEGWLREVVREQVDVGGEGEGG